MNNYSGMASHAPMQVIPFRLPEDLVKRLDRYAERLSREQRGMRFTRADVVRVLLTEGLDRVEGRHGKA